MYQPLEYYWVKVQGEWEICQAITIPYCKDRIGFAIMGEEGTMYTVDNIEQSIHIPIPSDPK